MTTVLGILLIMGTIVLVVFYVRPKNLEETIQNNIKIREIILSLEQEGFEASIEEEMLVYTYRHEAKYESSDPLIRAQMAMVFSEEVSKVENKILAIKAALKKELGGSDIDIKIRCLDYEERELYSEIFRRVSF